MLQLTPGERSLKHAPRRKRLRLGPSMNNHKRIAFLGFRRGGSSIAFQILETLLNSSGLGAHDIVKENHKKQIPIPNIKKTDFLNSLSENAMIGAFREKPFVLSAIDEFDIRPVLVVRDPRDCILSWFHAQHLHREINLSPEDKILDISGFLKKDDRFYTDVSDLIEFTIENNGLIIKYEDLIDRPVMFIRKFLEFSELPVSRDAVDLAIIRANFQQIVQDPASHNRSGGAFDALRVQPQAIIDELNERFGNVVRQLDYPLTADELPPSNIDARMEIDAIKRYILNLAQQNSFRIKDLSQLKEKLNIFGR